MIREVKYKVIVSVGIFGELVEVVSNFVFDYVGVFENLDIFFFEFIVLDEELFYVFYIV